MATAADRKDQRREKCSWGFGGRCKSPNGSRTELWWEPGGEAPGRSGVLCINSTQFGLKTTFSYNKTTSELPFISPPSTQPFSSVSIINFEQVNAGWVKTVSCILFKNCETNF